MSIRKTLLLLGMAVSIGCDGDVVARMGGETLTVEQLAQTVADGRVAVRAPIVERFAWDWLQHALFADRLAQGDSMLDTATVLTAMFPDVFEYTSLVMLDSLMAQTLRLDSAAVDSAYYGDDFRIADHILIRWADFLSDEDKAARRRTIDSLHTFLMSGGSWSDAVESSEDLTTKNTGGHLGGFGRGAMVPAIDQAIFALEPGSVSEVVESDLGFHIIRRPTLEEVWETWAKFAEPAMEELWRMRYLDRLAEAWNVAIRDNAVSVVLEASGRPFQSLSRRSPRTIATYDGGQFTEVDLVHWLQALPIQFHTELDESEGDQTVRLIETVLQSHVQYLEGQRAGVALPEEVVAHIFRLYEDRYWRVRSSLRADSSFSAVSSRRDRERAAAEAATGYLGRISGLTGSTAIVPPFLAAKLRSEGKWRFYPANAERAFVLAESLRAARDSASQEDSRR